MFSHDNIWILFLEITSQIDNFKLDMKSNTFQNHTQKSI